MVFCIGNNENCAQGDCEETETEQGRRTIQSTHISSARTLDVAVQEEFKKYLKEQCVNEPVALFIPEYTEQFPLSSSHHST